MAAAFDNIHPGLSQDDAISILKKPASELDMSSDYYMAVSHLLNFPGEETEKALMKVASDLSTLHATKIARRKSVEVLARLNCFGAIDIISKCLFSDDIYLVEVAIWSLQYLNCKDLRIHQILVDMLRANTTNQRILIKCLSSLKVNSAIEIISGFRRSEIPSIRTAACSGYAILTSDRSSVLGIEESLFLPKQMDRQMALEDLASCKGIELMKSALKTPVSPIFRIRFLYSVWPKHSPEHFSGFNLFSIVDQLIIDSPLSLDLSNVLELSHDIDELFNTLLSNDFSKAYLALITLSRLRSESLWKTFLFKWRTKAQSDYGGHYFFILLINFVDTWPSCSLPDLKNILLDAIFNVRPQFSKSRPVAFLAFSRLFSKDITNELLLKYLKSTTSSWQMQYACFIAGDKDILLKRTLIDMLSSNNILMKNNFSKMKMNKFVGNLY